MRARKCSTSWFPDTVTANYPLFIEKRMKTKLILLTLLGGASIAVGAPLELGSLASRPSASGSAGSFAPVFSADGRFVIFLSQGRNLVTDDNLAPLLQVYRRDLNLGITELVSIGTGGKGGANQNASAPGISADGRYIVFESEAGNLVAGDTNGVSDVFVRDMDLALTTLVSVTTDGLRSGNRASHAPQMTPSGRHVVFGSESTDLVTGDTNGLDDIFIRDLGTGETQILGPQPWPSSGSFVLNVPVISVSDNGQVAAFESRIPFDSNSPSNVVTVWKMASLESQIVSLGVTNFAPPGVDAKSFNPRLDALGRMVTFFAIPSASLPVASLFAFDLSSNVLTRVATNARADDPAPLTAGGEWTAYVQSDALYLCNISHGTNLQICGPAGLTNLFPRSTPVLNPSGSRLLFSASINSNDPPVLLSYEPASGGFTTLSVNSNGLPAAIDLGSLPSMSDDGARVAYVSAAANIVASDFNQEADVFCSDSRNGQTLLVSERAPGRVHSATHRVASYNTPVVSANGRFLVFLSTDNELMPGDNNPWTDVFVRDRLNNTLERLVPTNRPSGARICLRPAVSEDGRYMAWLEQDANSTDPQFDLSLTNIVWMDRQTGESRFVQATSSQFRMPFQNGPALSPNGHQLAFVLSGQLYLRDMSLPGTNYSMVSTNYNSPVFYSGASGNPRFTPDGQWLIFSSTSGALVSNTPSITYGVYARNLAENTTRLVSVRPADFAISSVSLNYQVCSDSRHVLYTLTSGSESRAYLADLATTNAPVAVCSTCSNPSASADGRFVAFDRQQTFGGPFSAYVRDLQTGTTELASQRTDGTAATNGFACTPVISGDGRFVAYRGGDSRLVANDANDALDLFMRDRLLGFNFSITRQASARSHYFSPGSFGFGADGRTLLVSSLLPGLTQTDFSPSADVFLFRVGATDSDGDGMDDEWELAFFDTLARAGSGDFDGDGASDKSEFLAGTDPTNAGSTLPVLAISAVSSSSRTLFWNAIPGRSYRAEYKNAAEVPGWTPVGAEVIAASTTASLVDSTIGTNTLRFYRVRILP